MARPITRGRNTLNVTEQHRAWLELVDTDGPFLAIPPLKRVWPQGMPSLAEERKTALVDARKEFEPAWEKLDLNPGSQGALEAYRVGRDQWVKTVLRDVAGWAESLAWGEVPGVTAQSPNHSVTIRAQAALRGPDCLGAVVHVIDPVDSLRETPGDLWAANPIDRVEVMLRENNIPIGIVTDGRWWGLVSAREGAMAASGIVDALTWIEEPRTRDAFLTLIGRPHLIGGDPAERLPVLFEQSVAAAEEITEALGSQVRRAVELLIQSFSESAADARRRGHPECLPERTHDAYEAAVTVMMRVVFLLFAEERGLLPSGELFEQGYGVARELDRLIARETEESEEALDATSLTWHRLLATSIALYRGASFESLRMPAYGGSLFDPDRFPFLTALNDQGTLSISVSDRVMLHVLRSVQVANINGEARRISFRDIDVEQIGYIYEGLLGYTASVAPDVTVGLKGKLGEEPEIPLATLESLAEEHEDPKALAAAIIAFVKETQPSATPASVPAIAKALNADAQPGVVSALSHAVGDNLELRDRVMPWLELIRLDLRKRPVVILPGGLIVKETPSRKNAGAHYTPKSLAEEVVLHALQPVCYSPGPHQTAQETEWRLKSSDELLDLKVADIACGSGAFLVAAARYLALRVVEAWTAEEPGNAARKDLYTRAIRQVVANCLYGADINDMAVEMCKLSLWLVSLDRDLPFSFVDDKVFLGNSLLGVTNLDQLRRLHIDPKVKTEMEHYEAYDFDVDGIIQRAIELRRRLLAEIDEHDPARSSAAKRRQLQELNRVTGGLRAIADGIIATRLSSDVKPGRALKEAFENLRLAVRAAYPEKGAPDHTFLQSLIESGLTPTVETDYERWRPLHWVIEAPDVMVDRGGFDAIIGNPAFLHSKKITTAFGKNYRDFLQAVLASGRAGDADLAAYFLLRQASLLASDGTIGIVVTKSILQSHTKMVGLDQVLESGATLVNASRPFDWGPRGAAVSVVKIWVTTVRTVDSRNALLGNPEQPSGVLPVRAFVGTYPNGEGFRVSSATAREWLGSNPQLAAQLLPYIRAADLAQGDPLAPSEYLIDLDGLELDRARTIEPLWSHLVRYQRPWRQKPKTKPHLQARWWDFESSASALYSELRQIERAIAIPRTSNLLMPRWIPAGTRVDMGVVVFPVDDWSIYAQIASSLHYHWVLSYGATTRDDPSYAPRRLSNTFPWMEMAKTTAAQEFERVLERLCRAVGGLRAVMNAFNDPTIQTTEIEELRDRFVELDAEVLEAFGWSDLPARYGFYDRNNLRRFTIDRDSQNELMRRLLAVNQVRAEGASKRPLFAAADTGLTAQAQRGLFSDDH